MTANSNGLTTRKILVYLLAAPEDREVCQAIGKHLRPVVRDFRIPIEVNSDFDIPSGADVAAHRKRLFDADIVLVLISADFIGNDEVYDRVRQVTERHNTGNAVMVPLLVRNCMWKATPFARLNVLPRNLQPMNSRQAWPTPDDALTVVIEDIYASLNDLAQRGDVPLAPPPAATVAAPPPAAPLRTVDSMPQATSQAGPATAAGASPAGPAAVPLPLMAPAFAAAPEPAPTRSGSLGADATQLNADWRQKYYRNVVWKRAGALALDYLFAFVLAWIIVVILVLLGTGLLANDTNGENTNDVVGVIFFLTFYLVVPLFESSSWQATPGKRIMKLQITDSEGHRIGFFRACLRNVLRSVVFYLYIFLVPLLIQWWRFGKTKKLFHDEWSSTVIGERLSRAKPGKLAAMPA